jgi:hypothetical protein
MKTVTEIINLLTGGITGLMHHPIKLEVEGYMPLCVEWIGVGPRGYQAVSVAMYFEQCGDLMRDPDVVFEISDMGNWLPVSFRNDGLGIDHEAVYRDGKRVMIREKLVTDLTVFARQWDRDLKTQGFLDAAKKLAASK